MITIGVLIMFCFVSGFVALWVCGCDLLFVIVIDSYCLFCLICCFGVVSCGTCVFWLFTVWVRVFFVRWLYLNVLILCCFTGLFGFCYD